MEKLWGENHEECIFCSLKKKLVENYKLFTELFP